MSSVSPPHSTDCSPNKSVSVSSRKVVLIIGARLDELEMNVEAMTKRKIFARGQMRLNLTLENVGGHLVRHQHHDDVGLARGVSGLEDSQAVLFSLGPRWTPLAQPDSNIHAAVAQIKRVGMPLAAKSQDRYLVSPQYAQIRVAIIKHFHPDPLLTNPHR